MSKTRDLSRLLSSGPGAISGFSANTIVYANTSGYLTNSSNLTFNGTTVTSANPINVPNTFGFKNRIINGDMRIDQRNAGASVTPASGTSTYITDRFTVLGTQSSKFTAQQNAGSVTPPTGFSHYLGVTSSSAYSSISSDLFRIFHAIEGYNIADFAWGTANAKTVTLSFKARSSLTGTFGGCIQNQSNNRAYAFTYSISSANTWTDCTVTIPGETTGTWYTNNTLGLAINFDLGSGSSKQITPGSWQATDANAATGCVSVVGTNGATLYITGIQLEVGSQATSFDYREINRELDMCKRYFQKSYKQTEKPGTVQGDIRSGMCFHNSSSISGQAFGPTIMLPITMRTDPSVVVYDHLGATSKVTGIASNTGQTAGVSYNDIGTSDTRLYIRCYDIGYYGFGFHYTLSAEL